MSVFVNPRHYIASQLLRQHPIGVKSVAQTRVVKHIYSVLLIQRYTILLRIRDCFLR